MLNFCLNSQLTNTLNMVVICSELKGEVHQFTSRVMEVSLDERNSNN